MSLTKALMFTDHMCIDHSTGSNHYIHQLCKNKTQFESPGNPIFSVAINTTEGLALGPHVL